MKLSVIIVNYNVEYFLEQCLLSVRSALKEVEGEVIVVDNHSNDGSNRMVKKKFPEVRLVENKDNLGFSRAKNQGIRLAKGEYVLLLNPDTVVEDDTFVKIIRFMDDHPANTPDGFLQDVRTFGPFSSVQKIFKGPFGVSR